MFFIGDFLQGNYFNDFNEIMMMFVYNFFEYIEVSMYLLNILFWFVIVEI